MLSVIVSKSLTGRLPVYNFCCGVFILVTGLSQLHMALEFSMSQSSMPVIPWGLQIVKKLPIDPHSFTKTVLVIVLWL